MKKYCFVCLLVMLGIFGLCGCQSKGETGVNTENEIPITKAMEPTATPTEMIRPTEVTEPTVIPTEIVRPTEVTEPTDVPTEIVQPTETVEPTVTPEIVSPTEIVRPTTVPSVTEQPTPAIRLVEYTYDFNDMSCLDRWADTYQVNEDGSMRMQFSGQYDEVRWAFPGDIDMKYCQKIVVKAKCEYAPMSMKLYNTEVLEDIWTGKFYETDACQAKGIAEYEIIPNTDAQMAGIGFTSLNEVDDYSKYIVTVYSVSLYLEEGYEPKEATEGIKVVRSGEVTYRFADLEILNSNVEEYKKNNDGSIRMRFGENGEEMLFLFPEAIDTRYCSGITIQYQIENCRYLSPDGNIACVDYYDKVLLRSKAGKVSFSDYNLGANGADRFMITPSALTEIYGIGIVGNYSGKAYTTTLYSITFHMESETTAEIPKDIAPDVTADMTLLNTYGSVLGHIGTGIVLDDARHPAVLNEIKKDFDTLTMCYEMGHDFIFGMYNGKHKFISPDEAKQLGYHIPKNYKDKTVPFLDFTSVDEMMKLCAENGMRLRYHNLICHLLDDSWWFFKEDYSDSGEFVTPTVMDARMEFYIRSVMEHVYNSEYGYVVYAWEVVNEYFHTNEESWTGVYGEVNLKPEFVKLAFTIADDVLKQYGIRDQVALIYNDYHTFYVGEEENTPQCLIEILSFVNEDGKVCDGIGMQGHMGFDYPKKKEDFTDALQKFLDAGLDVYITELGFEIGNKNDANEVARQEEFYCWLFKEFLRIKSSGGRLMEVNFCGTWDDSSHIPERAPYFWSNPGNTKDMYYRVLQAYLDEGYKVK